MIRKDTGDVLNRNKGHTHYIRHTCNQKLMERVRRVGERKTPAGDLCSDKIRLSNFN